MRVLFIAHSGNRGGAERSLDTILAHLDHDRLETEVLFAWEGPMVQSARAMGHNVAVAPLAWWMCFQPSLWYFKDLLIGSLPRILRLTRKIENEGIDLVYSNTAVIFEAALAARLARVPHIWHVREILRSTHMRPRILPLPLIIRLINRLSNRVIFVSEGCREICARAVPDEKAVVIRNSVPFEVGTATKGVDRLRERFGIAPDQLVVLWAGRFSSRKDPLLLIRSISRMDLASEARFLFAGTGPLREEMVRTIEQLGLENVCLLIGFQEDIRPVLATADVVVSTSQEEAFGLVLIEAGALGKPVVATRAEGPAEIVLDGETGLLVEPGNERDLAAKLDRLMADKRLRQALGNAASSRTSRLFSAKRNVRRIEDVIEDAVASIRTP